MTIRTPLQGLVFAAVCGAAVYLAAQTPTTTQAPAPVVHVSSKTVSLNQRVPTDPQITVGKLPNGLRYYIRDEPQAGEARGAAARRQRRLGARGRRPARARALRRAHGVQRHAALPEAGHRQLHAVDRHAVRRRTSTRTRASTRRSTSCRFRPTGRTCIDKVDAHPRGLGAQRRRSIRRRSTRSAASSLEEWRLGRGAAARMQRQAVSGAAQGLALRGAAADRQARDHPERSSPSRLKQFYKDWYRPDLMAVIAVGDFDKAAVEALIKQHFGSIPSGATSPKPRPTYAVPDQPGTLYTIATDQEATTTTRRASTT